MTRFPLPEPAAWIRTHGPDDAPPQLAEVFREIAGRAGSVAHVLRSQSLHPEALRDHYRLYRTLMYGRGELSRAQREAIAVAVSSTNRCRY